MTITAVLGTFEVDDPETRFVKGDDVAFEIDGEVWEGGVVQEVRYYGTERSIVIAYGFGVTDLVLA